MKYVLIEVKIDLNDPERGFQYVSDEDKVTLSFYDWKNREIAFIFYTVYSFRYFISNGYRNIPEAAVVELQDSKFIESLRNDFTASKDEELHHYILSTNEDEWCEIIAEKYELKIG